MRDDVIYPGPARVVLAAASQLREPSLIERHGEEWLANLCHRTRRQQWCDAVSLLVRGARLTRWAYDGTYDSRSPVVIVGRMIMAIIVTIGTTFLIAIPERSRLIVFSFHNAAYYKITDERYLLLYLALAVASALGLALEVKRSWWVVVGGMAVGVLATSCAIWLSPISIVSCSTSQRPIYAVCIVYNGEPSFQVPASDGHYDIVMWGFGGLDIVMWGAVAASLVAFAHRTVATSIRALAAVEVVVILGSAPSVVWSRQFGWLNFPYQYADFLGLADLDQLLPDLLSSVTFGAITTLQVTPGLAFLLSGIAVRSAMQCATIVRSLNRSKRGNLGGTWACLQ